MSEEFIVRLKIVSDCHDAVQISENIGLTPDRCWKIGDERGNTTIVEKNHGWILNSNLPKSTILEGHMEHLLSRVFPRADKIRMYAEHGAVEFSCVIYASSPPALNFSKLIINKINLLGASLDIDLYIINDEILTT